MSVRVPLPAAFRLRAFTRADAAAVGLGRERLNSPDLQRPFHGVRSNGLDLERTAGLCRAYAARMPPSHAFSHSTAAELLGLPLPWALRQGSALHVTAPPGSPAPRARGVIGHRGDAMTSTVYLVEGLRVLAPETVWCQLAAELSLGHLVAVGDALLGGRHCASTAEQLRLVVARWSPRRGVAALRQALPLIRAGVDSPKETELRLFLLGLGLPEPLVNRRYFDEHGRYLGRADLSWPELRIVFEYEGDQHRTDRETFRRDLSRRERFESASWSVIRVTDHDLGVGRRGFERTVRARIRRQSALLGIECAQ